MLLHLRLISRRCQIHCSKLLYGWLATTPHPLRPHCRQFCRAASQKSDAQQHIPAKRFRGIEHIIYSTKTSKPPLMRSRSVQMEQPCCTALPAAAKPLFTSPMPSILWRSKNPSLSLYQKSPSLRSLSQSLNSIFPTSY